MSNLSDFKPNVTQTLLLGNRDVMTVLSVTPCVVFLYVNGVMLFTLRKRAVFQEASRYILFGHMLWLDTLNLSMGVLMFVIGVSRIIIMKIVCFILLVAATVFYQVSILNLALMSLERYVAICFPLRHADFTSYRRTNMSIGVVWMIGCLQSLTEIIISNVIDTTNTAINLLCSRTTVFRLQIFKNLDVVFTCIYFVSVSFVVIFTYVSIAIIAKSASCDKVSAKKANKTVLLHLLQLGMGSASILVGVILEVLYVYTNYMTSVSVMYFSFVVFQIFPRCLSPLIYGLRDQAFGSLFKYYFTFGLKKQNTCHTETHLVAGH